MTHHLTRDELIDSLDRCLAPDRHAHAESCAACRAEIASLRDVMRDVAAVDVPEPSPLFWDHLSAHISARVAEEPLPAPRRGLLDRVLGREPERTLGRETASGWRATWWPHGAFAAAVLVLCAGLGWIGWTELGPGRSPRGAADMAKGPADSVVQRPSNPSDPRSATTGQRSAARSAIPDGTARGVADDVGSVDGSALELMPANGNGDHGHEWALMMRMAEEVSWEDVEGTPIAVPPGTVDRAFSELTSDERRTLARLVQAELARPPL